ncbi:MAG: phytanoyl-CoA dioxygenase family protein [Bacteroidetes bacterium]|nr:phytanoyl-CoA dioxygenase family protein [Bacteroidota bacterium]
MIESATVKKSIDENGFAILDSVFSHAQVTALQELIEQAGTVDPSFRKTDDLFAIRRFFKVIPAATPLIFTKAFNACIESWIGPGYFVVKSLYFDKPALSNWFVAFHQDQTIAVDRKMEEAGFGPWRVKQGQYAVQPPTVLLEDNFTIRIHLDDTTEENGALQVIPGSHRIGVIRPEQADLTGKISCPVARGGIMIMKPLLLHASSRTVNNARRRVVHIEFSRQELPAGMQWAEKMQTGITNDHV